MKKIYLLLLLLLGVLNTQAQNCYFTANITNGNVVTFIPTVTPPFFGGPLLWNFGNGASINAPNGPITQTYPTAGVYNVCMSLYDSTMGNLICQYCDSILINGCSATASQQPANPFQFTFTASLQWPSGSTAHWSFGDGTAGTGSPVNHTYSATGNYVVTMTEKDSAGNTICSTTIGVTVSNTSNPSCSFAYIPGVPPQGSNIISFIGTSNMSNPVYTWDFGDGSPMVTGPSPQHGYGTAGAYNVCVYVSNGVDSCSDCKMIPVVVGGGNNCSFQAFPDSSNNSFYYFQGVPSGIGTSISWSFGDGSNGFGQFPTHQYTAPGTYQVCMNELDSNGLIVCSYCQAITITGSSVPSCLFTATPSPANPTVVVFNAQATPGTTYQWNFGNGQTTSGGPIATAIYNSPGVYNVCLIVTGGGIVDTCCVSVTVGSTSNCTYTWVADTMNTNTVYFLGTPSSSGTTLVWDFGDSTGTVTGYNPVHNFPGPGTYTVCMMELDTNGTVICQQCQNVTITSNGNCSFTVNAQPATPFTFNFVANSLIGTTFIWDFGDGTTGNGQGISHTYTSPGTYTVCLSIGIGGAIVCTGCQTVYVASNSWCQASFSSVSLGLNAYFIDQSTIVPITMPPVPPAVNYSWSFGDGNTSNLQFPNHQYAAPGTYLVCLTASTVGCTTTYCDSIVIDTAINNPTTCNAYFVFTQTSPYNVVGVNLASGINLSFNWSFGDGTSSTLPYPTHQYTSTGSYVVCLTVSDINGCSSTYCDTLTVDSLGNVVYRGVTSAGFTLNIVAPNLLGIEDSQPAIGTIFPVPATEEINIRFTENVKEEVVYNVMSMDGRRILNGQLTGTNATLNIASLQQGIYLLEVITSDGRRDSKYFVKQ